MEVNKGNKFSNDSGYTLIGVVLIITIISVLGMSIVGLTLNSLHTSSAERDDQSVFYIAEAGLTAEIPIIEKKINDIYQSKNYKDAEVFFDDLNDGLKKLNNERLPNKNFEPVFGKYPEAEIVVNKSTDYEKSDETRSYIITSIGKIGEENRTVERAFEVKWVPKTAGMPELALLVSDRIKMTTSAKVNGDIGTLSTRPKSIELSTSATINGDVYVPHSAKHIAIDKDITAGTVPEPIGEVMGEKLPQLPKFPTVPNHLDPKGKFTVSNSQRGTIDKNGKYGSISVSTSGNLIIDTSKGDITIVVDNLSLSTSSSIDIRGNGTLTIFITEDFSMSTSSTFNNRGDVSKLNIYYKGADKVKLSTSTKIYGSLYAENASIDLSTSGEFIGNIFTGGSKVKISTSGTNYSRLILAPYAEIDISTSAIIKGAIIGKSVEMSTSSQIIYEELDFIEGPISPDGLNGGDDTGSLTITPSALFEK